MVDVAVPEGILVQIVTLSLCATLSWQGSVTVLSIEIDWMLERNQGETAVHRLTYHYRFSLGQGVLTRRLAFQASESQLLMIFLSARTQQRYLGRWPKIDCAKRRTWHDACLRFNVNVVEKRWGRQEGVGCGLQVSKQDDGCMSDEYDADMIHDYSPGSHLWSSDWCLSRM